MLIENAVDFACVAWRAVRRFRILPQIIASVAFTE